MGGRTGGGKGGKGGTEGKGRRGVIGRGGGMEGGRSFFALFHLNKK